MLWIGVCEAVSVAMMGGVVGGCLMALAQRQSNKFNMNMMEQHWKDDCWQLRNGVELAHAKINEVTQKLSTLSVSKPVSNGNKYSNNKGYKHQRHFDQRG